jgi:signal transduction histidine kinase
MAESGSQQKHRHSLSFRLIAAASVWIVVLLAAGGLLLTVAFRDSARQEFGQRLDALLRAMIATMEVGPDGGIVLAKPLGDARFDQVFSGWYWQIAEPSGRLIRSRSLWDSSLPVHDDGADMGHHDIEGPKGEPLMAAERDLQFPGVADPVHVMIAGDLRELDERVRRFDLLLISALGLFALGMVGAIVLQVRFGLRPLRAIEADLDAIRNGLSARLPDRYPAELAPLVSAMNAVLDHDAVLIERARTHVGNLAHSLKTALAVLQAELRGKPELRTAEDQIGVMSRLIEHHLARAAASAGSGRVLGVKTAVKPVAEQIVGVLQRVYADKAINVEMDIATGSVVPMAREDVEEVLGNLMENAWKWARSRIRISANAQGIVIEDDGPGLSPEQAVAVSRRGARLDEAMPGWGLGLAIVADIVALNGASLVMERSEWGGLKAIVSFAFRA